MTRTSRTHTFSFVIAIALLSSFLWGQSPELPKATKREAIEKKIVEIEEKTTPLLDELRDLRRQLKALTPVTFVPLHYVKPSRAAEIAQNSFRGNLDIEIEALPKMQAVAIQAEAKLADDAKDLLERLDTAASKGPRPFGYIRGSFHLDDVEIAVVVIEWVRAKEAKKTKK